MFGNEKMSLADTYKYLAKNWNTSTYEELERATGRTKFGLSIMRHTLAKKTGINLIKKSKPDIWTEDFVKEIRTIAS